MDKTRQAIKNQIELAKARVKVKQRYLMSKVMNEESELCRLIMKGEIESALLRGEELVNNDYRMGAYVYIARCLDQLLTRIDFLLRERTIPPAVQNSVYSVIYATPHMAEIDELPGITAFFARKYGKELPMRMQTDYLPSIDPELRKYLSLDIPSDSAVDARIRMVTDARGITFNNPRLNCLANDMPPVPVINHPEPQMPFVPTPQQFTPAPQMGNLHASMKGQVVFPCAPVQPVPKEEPGFTFPTVPTTTPVAPRPKTPPSSDDEEDIVFPMVPNHKPGTRPKDDDSSSEDSDDELERRLRNLKK